MTRTFRTALALPVLAAAAIAVSGCASTAVANQAAGDASREVKLYRTGSKLPVLVPFYGPEIVKSTDAANNRDEVNRIVAPVRPLNSQ